MTRWELENRDYQAWRTEPALEAIEQRRKAMALRRAKRWINNIKNANKRPPAHIARGLSYA